MLDRLFKLRDRNTSVRTEIDATDLQHCQRLCLWLYQLCCAEGMYRKV